MNYKICVYAICKNEEKFVERWLKSVLEADLVLVLDTGSTDNSVKALENGGAIVYEEIFSPWRFDDARNKALSLIPDDYDICISLDMDEILNEGWRDKLEKEWENSDRLFCNLVFSFDENGNPATTYYTGRIHSRKNYEWVYPIHEVVKFKGVNEKVKYCDNIVIEHHPDVSKSRGFYLELLETAVLENPTDARLMHYLGREYMYASKWNETIDTLISYLELKSATWHEERSASMRYIARSYEKLNRKEEVRLWFNKSVIESPKSREPFVEYAWFEYKEKNWPAVKFLLDEALKITERNKTYINEYYCWDSTVYDLLSIAEFNLGNYELAVENVNKAIELSPQNKRLKDNLELYIEHKKNNKN